jgi:hypothetical protein
MFKAIAKIKKRGTPLDKRRRASSKTGTVSCVCKKTKPSGRSDITIGGKMISSRSKDSPVNHVRLKRHKGMSEGVWALTGGVDNPCRCKLVSGTMGKKKSRVLNGVNMVSLKWS